MEPHIGHRSEPYEQCQLVFATATDDRRHPRMVRVDSTGGNRRMENYNKNDVKQWTNKLTVLRERMTRPPMIELQHDDDAAPFTEISFIQ